MRNRLHANYFFSVGKTILLSALSQFFPLSLDFRSLATMCLGMDFFEFNLNLLVCVFCTIWQFFRHYFFKCFSTLLSFSSSSRTLNIRSLVKVARLSETRSIFLKFIFLSLQIGQLLLFYLQVHLFFPLLLPFCCEPTYWVYCVDYCIFQVSNCCLVLHVLSFSAMIFLFFGYYFYTFILSLFTIVW